LNFLTRFKNFVDVPPSRGEEMVACDACGTELGVESGFCDICGLKVGSELDDQDLSETSGDGLAEVDLADPEMHRFEKSVRVVSICAVGALLICMALALPPTYNNQGSVDCSRNNLYLVLGISFIIFGLTFARLKEWFHR
jgi:hypothetical protein